jgi:regulatory protein
MPLETKENNLLKLEKIVKEKNLYKAFFVNGTQLLISESDILAYALYKDACISNETYQILKGKEAYYLCLQDALQIVNYKAYAIKQVKDKLKLKKHGTHDIDRVIKYLVQQEILNDELFKESYINLKITQGYGPRYIQQKLSEKGIKSRVDIEPSILEARLLKYFNALYKAEETKSYAHTKFLNKMINKGYEKEMIEALLATQDVSYTNEQLKREYQKMYDKLKKKYHDYELIAQLKMRLFHKGYSHSEIDDVMREDVNDEYYRF